MYYNNNSFYGNIFNPQYVSRDNYARHQAEIASYQANQDIEVTKAVKAMHDLCEEVNKMDADHQQQAMVLCPAEIAREFGWHL